MEKLKNKEINQNHFINRELSWLSFNSRVLDQAFEMDNPILERLKFMAIFSNNLDEFFMVRVAGVRQMFENKDMLQDPSGMLPNEQLKKIRTRTKTLVKKQYKYFKEHIVPELSQNGINLLNIEELEAKETDRLSDYFDKEIMPILTPVGFDPTHPFPVINNKEIVIAVALKQKNKKPTFYGFVEVPASISRFVAVNYSDQNLSYVLLEDVIIKNISKLFTGCQILDVFPFRITKDMDFSVGDIDDSDMLKYMEKKLKSTRNRKAIRIELPKYASEKKAAWLIEKLYVTNDMVYEIDGPLNLASFFEFIGKVYKPELSDKKILPLTIHSLEEGSIFDAIKKHGTIPIFHPFESFDYVVKLLEEAASDPNVLAIKQTLYRVSGDSPIVHALQNAAESGKQVTVIVELKARFDEKRNILWAKRLEMSGAHVIYGMEGLKIHCKSLLIVRKEEDSIRRYLHLSTGNYNDSTARIYTDIGIFTSDTEICSDTASLFNVMTGYSEPHSWSKLAVAPFDLREKFISLIDREARISTKHNPGHIIAKMNSLVDTEIIEHLYKAAYAGVKVDLLVRGICCLNPGIETRNITVTSIVDRYLEHSRIYYFENNGSQEYYLSSADWMPRNLDRRIEILFPVEDDFTCTLLANLLNLQINDSFKGRRLNSSGHYLKNNLRNKDSQSQIKTYELLQEMRPTAQKKKYAVLRKEI